MRLHFSTRGVRVYNRILGVWGTVIGELNPEVYVVQRDAPMQYETTWRKENVVAWDQATTAAAVTAPLEPITVRQERRWPTYDDLLAWFLSHKQARTPAEVLLALAEFRDQGQRDVHRLLYEADEAFRLEFAVPGVKEQR